MLVIGLMSGTSADGMDVALCEVEGAPPRLTARIRHAFTRPYAAPLRQAILAACQPETGRVDALCRLNVTLAEAFAAAIDDLLREAHTPPAAVTLIGSHGQTVWHEVLPDGRVQATLQLTEASVLAERTGITVISNFRARDVAAGGQGAPLTGYVDWLLLRHPQHWRAIQNIGGMGNVTFLPPLSDAVSPPVAWDTGPGNALIDAAVYHLTGATYDAGGALAAAGAVDEAWLAALLQHPYLARRPPKTTGRELFGTAAALALVQQAQAAGLNTPAIIATLTAFTAASIADSYRRFAPAAPGEIILGGGGRHNTTLVNVLQSLLPGSPVRTHEDVGLNSDFKEALVFAVLAYETWHHRPGTLPALTGAHHATVLGQITPGTHAIQASRKTGP
ncbi:MAG: anhydro-N-acetylmuramic acid kinase [Anaerolineae bacterium]|jgi:anhydro-N-acetylmuramic acid kinase|nr:anhydro-N-acetylmuramic acid kinase [Anaerolineae bacterium]